MGTITRGLANNILSNGVIAASGITNESVSAITSFPNASGGTMVKISSQTASGASSIEITSGIDSTYNTHILIAEGLSVSTDLAEILFNFSTDSGSTYAVPKQTVIYYSYNDTTGTSNVFEYSPGDDATNGTGDHNVIINQGNEAKANGGFVCHMYGLADTTFAKQFQIQAYYFNGTSPDYMTNIHIGGYMNTTSAINGIRVLPSAGTFSGNLTLYGLVKS